jgi:hypothetical protein
MKYNKIITIQIATCLFFFLFFINISMAQQNLNNENSLFTKGTILSTDNGTRKAELKMSGKAYDEYMIGVFSDSEKAENNAIIKTSSVISGGVAYVKCNSNNGLVKKGDLITSSSEPGVGMKATESGIVLGLALEDASGSSGLVKIRIMIQYVKQ